MSIERQLKRIEAQNKHIIVQNEAMFEVIGDVAGHFISPKLVEAGEKLRVSSEEVAADLEANKEPEVPK